MDLLDRLLGHDSWTTRQMLVLCRELSDEELDREFDIGHRTLRATFLHIIRNVEWWSDLMDGRAKRVQQGESVMQMIGRLDIAAADLARVARSVASRAAWDESWVDPGESPHVERTFGGTIAHVITHSMHHRAQVLYLMRRLDVEGLPEGDVLSWENQVASDQVVW